MRCLALLLVAASLAASFPVAAADPCTDTYLPPAFESPAVGTDETRIDVDPVHVVVDPVPLLSEGDVTIPSLVRLHQCAYTTYPLGVTAAVVPEGATCTLNYQYLATVIMPVTGTPRYDVFLVTCTGDMVFVGVVAYQTG